jgi:DNA polymerase III subunit epsilon
MRFVAIDVETASARYHSICQIGVVLFEDGHEVAAERVFVDPREEFGEWQIRIHGILPEHVAGADCFPDRYDWLHGWTNREVVVSHSHFDRSALGLACDLHGLPRLGCEWIDSVSVAMSAWPGLKSYKLNDIAARLGISFRHHDALEDARACGLVVQQALVGGLLPMAASTADRTTKREIWPANVCRHGDGDGGLLGETIVFTGELSVSREVAADMAAEAGADVNPGPTKRTTMLVVGERDLQPGWQLKSNKHRRAEELIEQGLDIRIVSERDFVALAAIKE